MKDSTTWWKVQLGSMHGGIYPFEVSHATETTIVVVSKDGSKDRIKRDAKNTKYFDSEMKALKYYMNYLWRRIGFVEEELEFFRDQRSRTRTRLNELRMYAFPEE